MLLVIFTGKLLRLKMNYNFNIRNYVYCCLFITAVILAVFINDGLNTFKLNHDKKVATLMAFNQENYLQHRLIINALRSFFKSSEGVKPLEFEIFTQELLGKRNALLFTLTPELALGYISDEALISQLDMLETSFASDGSVSGRLPRYQLVSIGIDEPNMPYLFYGIPLENLLFKINKLKDSCLQYSSSQLSVERNDCTLWPDNMLSSFFRYSTDLDISIPEYHFYYTLGIDSQVSPAKLVEFTCTLLSILLLCILISVLLYFKLVSKHLFYRIERENKLSVAMVSSINHEIRTPINALLGYSKMLKGMPKISDEHNIVIDKMMWSANLLYSVAENTLNYSKSTTGELILNDTSINTLKYIDNIKNYYSELSVPADKTLTFHVSEKLPEMISIDSAKLFQVITNMINNALKYSTGQAVHCHIDICQRLGFNNVNVRSDYLRILIQDSGLGMSKSTKELLINPFTVDAESKLKQVSSIGLGLYTCNQLLTQIGGKLRLHSVVNEGTKIMLHFPCQRTASGSSPLAKPINYRDTGILIVDDNVFNLEVCSAMLAEKQFKTVCADSSTIALAQFVKTEPDIVIVDYQLDEVNGLELIAKMKCTQVNTQTQYFILSANDKNEIANSEQYPDIHFMQKPFNMAIFLSCLRKHD